MWRQEIIYKLFSHKLNPLCSGFTERRQCDVIGAADEQSSSRDARRGGYRGVAGTRTKGIEFALLGDKAQFKVLLLSLFESVCHEFCCQIFYLSGNIFIAYLSNDSYQRKIFSVLV
jgi:hypothetical protein